MQNMKFFLLHVPRVHKKAHGKPEVRRVSLLWYTANQHFVVCPTTHTANKASYGRVMAARDGVVVAANGASSAGEWGPLVRWSSCAWPMAHFVCLACGTQRINSFPCAKISPCVLPAAYGKGRLRRVPDILYTEKSLAHNDFLFSGCECCNG